MGAAVPIQLGLTLPQSGDLASPETIALAAREAEHAGVASVWVLERLLRPTHSTYAHMFEGYRIVYSPLETLAFVAAITSTLRLGTSALVTAFHSPVMLARRLATLDRLSAGRVIAALGQGYSPEEFAAAQSPTDRRGARFAEFISVMQRCWGPDPVAFNGRFFSIPPSEVGPKPTRAEGVPLLVAARSPRAAARAGARGLGLNPIVPDAWTELSAVIDSFKRAADAAGHDPGAVPIVLRVNGRLTSDDAGQSRAPLTGGIREVASDLQTARTLGVTEVLFDLTRFGVSVLEQVELVVRLRGALSDLEH